MDDEPIPKESDSHIVSHRSYPFEKYKEISFGKTISDEHPKSICFDVTYDNSVFNPDGYPHHSKFQLRDRRYMNYQ